MATNRPTRNHYGGMLIVGSMAIIGLIDNFVPIIAEEAGLWQFHMIRSGLTVPILAGVCLFRRGTLLPKRPGAVLFRSALIATAMLLYFGALATLPVAEAGAALFMSPIFILLFSVLLFRTPVGLRSIAAVAVGFAGVMMVLRPDPANLEFVAIIPLIAGIFYALGQLATRHMCSEEPTELVLLGFFTVLGLAGLVGTLLLTAFPPTGSWAAKASFLSAGWTPPTGRFLLWTCLQAFGSLIAVGGIVRGYQIAEPTFVGVYEYSFLLFAGFWGFVLWGDLPDTYGFVGIAAIALAGVVISLRPRDTFSRE